MFVVHEYGKGNEMKFSTLIEFAKFYYDDKEVRTLIDDRYNPTYIPETGYVKISSILYNINRKGYDKMKEFYINHFLEEVSPVIKRGGEAFWGGYVIKKVKGDISLENTMIWKR